MAISSGHSRTTTSRKRLSPGGAVAQSGKAHVVLAGARAVFLANGFSAATTDMIQQTAGVSKSTVYSYYPNKEALFVAVVEAECELYLKTVREYKFPERRLIDVLNAIAHAYLEIVLSHDGIALYRAIVSEAARFPELGRRFYLAGPGAMNNAIAETLEAAEARGEVDLGSVGRDSAASLLVNMVRGEAQMQSLTHPESPASAAQRDRWVKDAVTTFIRAFQKNASSGRR
ncbi:TetR/AcrR family transcriptional regulator [Paraburkholderia madseniana]|uniref:TetR/AcrR family transcriptional regulator n=1 Tax=Paraburkholderia madseniana TaxID=2599607 RepID=UPI001559079B|nr:TetR/AcrR family transcriptional regulator [Paraburkholderia madseniana]NPT70225.1 TetR family transcriptional regulator [Paraburkholderia madseniana]